MQAARRPFPMQFHQQAESTYLAKTNYKILIFFEILNVLNQCNIVNLKLFGRDGAIKLEEEKGQ